MFRRRCDSVVNDEYTHDRLSNVEVVSRENVDGAITTSKTKSMHVEIQETVAPPSAAGIEATENTYHHQCKWRDRHCETRRGLSIHIMHCNKQKELVEENVK